MTNIDRALRTLSRLQNAAPALAAARIAEVSTLLMRLNAENEYLNARLMESLDTSTGFLTQQSARGVLEKPVTAKDLSLEELFGVEGDAALNLFAELDSTLFTNEVAAAQPAPAAVPAPEPEESSLDVYEDLEALLREHGVSDIPQVILNQVELTEDERKALEDKFHDETDETPVHDPLPDPEEVSSQLNDIMKPTLLALRGEIEELVDGRMGRLTSNQSDTLRAMSGTTDGMLSLLDSLIIIHQLRQYALSIEPTEFNPLALLDTAHQMLRDRADDHDHQINIQIEPTLPQVRADFDRSLSIVLDILDNAILYTPDDSVIRVSADSIGSHVLFTIADSGIGFSAADSKYIATPFWRALHEPLVRNHHGTGLRLFLAKQILALQGGELFFSGEPNFGSSFSFTLPIV